MILDFNLADVPKIIFGSGKITSLPEILSSRNEKNILLVTGASSFQSSSYYTVLIDEIKSLNMSVDIETIKTEPSPNLVDSICEKYRNSNINIVIGIGGGSVLDAGKAVSAMLTQNDSIKHYLEGVGDKVHNGQKIPFIAVPTTSGTGSETTKNAVISDIREDGFKKSLRHDNFMPDLALIDPQLSLNLSPFQTAACGLDALSQLIESFTSSKASVFTDSLAIKAIEMLLEALPVVYKNGDDIQSRTAMSYAAMISGITLTNAGVGLIHGFASSVGGYYPVPHGVVCGTLIGIANRMNIEKLSQSGSNPSILYKYASIGQFIAKSTTESEAYYCDLLLNTLEEWLDVFKIPLLSDYGITEKDTEKIVSVTGLKNNPVSFTNDEMKEVLRDRIR